MVLENLEGFSQYLLREGRSIPTIKKHIFNLKRFAVGISSLDCAEIEKQLFKFKVEGLRGSSLNSYIHSLRMYEKFAHIDDGILRIKEFREEPFAKATMSDEEIEAFLAVPRQKKAHKALVNTFNLMFKLLAYCGMRPAEVCHLRSGDLDWGREVITLEDTKTHHPRLVPIPPNIKDDLKKHSLGKSGFLFPSPRNGLGARGIRGAMNTSLLGAQFRRRIKYLGIQRKNLSCYSLRHSLITKLLEEDVNLFKVQKLVGHRDIKTTAAYEHLTTKDVKEALSKLPIIRRVSDPRWVLTALVDQFNRLFDRDNRFEKSIEDKGDEIIIRVKIRTP